MALAVYDWPYRQTLLKFPNISESVANALGVELANDENFEGEADPFAAKEAHKASKAIKSFSKDLYMPYGI